jgi:glycosyltransferase involved in cell wall biosynthesis
MNSKPRILFLSTSLNIGGTEKFLVTLIDKLGPQYDFTVGYLKERGYYGEYLSKKNIRVEKLGGVAGVGNFIRKNKFDLIHTFLFRANIIGRIAAALHAHPPVISTQQAIDGWKNPFYVWLDSFTSRWSDLIIANSNTAKSILTEREKIPANKIKVVFNGVDLDRFAPGKEIGKDGPFIICTTRLHKEKGSDFLPAIAAGVKKGTFVIAGDGPERNELERSVKEKGLQNRFIFLGWRQDIPDLLAVSDIFILPSREESFPQSILEAMAMKLPVVAMNVGGVNELVENGNTGFLVPAGDTSAFSDAINTLNSDPILSARMGLNGYNKSLGFSEERMVASINSIYTELLERKNAV